MVRTVARKRQAFTEEDAAQLDPKLLQACAADKYLAIKTFFKVNDKDSNLVPVDIPEIIRQHYDASGEISLWGKGRQMYLTTSIDALFFQETIDRDGLNVWGLNLNEDKANENFRRVLDFDQYRHPALKELTHSVRNNAEIGYNETRSLYKAVTIKNDMTAAQADQVARTATCRRVRWTEAAFSRHYNVVKRALLDTMPRTNRKLVIETTGNGGQGGFWLDFMQAVNYGRPHPTLYGCWIFGNITAHFITWFQHHEYVREESPFDIESLPVDVQNILRENDKEHVEAMEKMGLSREQVAHRVHWMHMVLLEEKNLLTDPQGAVRNFNREYPATVAHMFQSTGSSWFSLSRISGMREFWKKENAERRVPLYTNLILQPDGKVEFKAGQDVMIFETPLRTHENRYCGILDPGGGTDDGDPTAGGILDRLLLKWVALFHGPFTPRRAAELLYKLGLYYDMALLNWENNSLGVAVTETLLELKYPNLYKNTKDRQDVSAYGWSTGPESRKEMLGEAKVYFDHPYTPINMPYLRFYDEAEAFQAPPGKQHRPEATGGMHDDLVMMYALGAVTHSKLMPPLVALAETRRARPGEASVRELAGLEGKAAGEGSYRSYAAKRRAGMRNF